MAVEAAVACILAVEAGSAEGRIRRPWPATEARVPESLPLRAQGVSTLQGPEATILDQAITVPGRAVISRAEINGMEIPFRRRLLSPTANGIPLAAHQEPVDPRARKRKPGPQITREASTSLAEIGEPDLPAQRAVFRVRAAKSGRMLPPREM
jgi:hypothetical protein